MKKRVWIGSWFGRMAVAVFVSTSTSSFAQAVYSANAVGYVDLDLAPGSNLVMNVLASPDSSISNLFKNVPDGSLFLPWNQDRQNFEPTNRFLSGTGWSDGAMQIPPLRGGFLWVPTAARVSLVGEPPPSLCFNFPAGLEALTRFPLAACAFCADFTDCPFLPTDGSEVRMWDRANQMWSDTFYFVEGVGWIPTEPVTAPGEGALLRSAQPGTGARWPGVGGGGGTIPRPPLMHPARDGTNFHVQFQAEAGANYRLQRCVRLSTNGWRTVSVWSTPTNGWVTLTDSTATNETAFYRLGPDLLLRKPARTGTTFGFEFEAEEGAAYIVSRKAALSDLAWTDIQTSGPSAGGLTTVTDLNATNSSGYYRLQQHGN